MVSFLVSLVIVARSICSSLRNCTRRQLASVNVLPIRPLLIIVLVARVRALLVSHTRVLGMHSFILIVDGIGCVLNSLQLWPIVNCLNFNWRRYRHRSLLLIVIRILGRAHSGGVATSRSFIIHSTRPVLIYWWLLLLDQLRVFVLTVSLGVILIFWSQLVDFCLELKFVFLLGWDLLIVILHVIDLEVSHLGLLLNCHNWPVSSDIGSCRRTLSSLVSSLLCLIGEIIVAIFSPLVTYIILLHSRGFLSSVQAADHVGGAFPCTIEEVSILAESFLGE